MTSSRNVLVDKGERNEREKNEHVITTQLLIYLRFDLGSSNCEQQHDVSLLETTSAMGTIRTCS
jgi:hypothetical protein